MIRGYFICALVLSTIGLGNCGILGGEDKENPIMWEEESLIDFLVLGYGYAGDNLYVIDPTTGEFESITQFETIYSVFSTPSTNKLYVSTGDGEVEAESGSIYEVNPATWEQKKIYHRPVEFIHSTSDEVFFVTKAVLDTGRFANFLPERVLGKINTPNGLITEIDTVLMAAANSHDYKAIQIHPNQPIAYLINDEFQLFEYNFESKQKNVLISGFNVTQHPNFSLSPDGRYIYFVGGPVFDTVREEIVGDIKVFKWGHAAVRRDNKEVYITDNGDLGVYNRPNVRNINIYSKSENSIIDTVNVGGTTGSIYITPKERYAFTNKRNIELLVIDLKDRSVIAEHDYEGEFSSALERIHILARNGAPTL